MTPSEKSAFNNNSEPLDLSHPEENSYGTHNTNNDGSSNESLLVLTEVGPGGSYIELKGKILQVYQFAPGKFVVYVPDGYNLVQEEVHNSCDAEFQISAQKESTKAFNNTQ